MGFFEAGAIMTDPEILRSVKSHLFSESETKIFAILDGAAIPGLQTKIAPFDPEHVCLYRGENAPDMAEVAPYLVILEHDSQFTAWVLQNCWGKRCAIFGSSPADLSTLRRHFRKFVMVYTETGKSVYFRFYDPRVLRAYLPCSAPDDLKIVFGPVTSYVVEDVDLEKGRKFTFEGNVLQEEWLSFEPGF
jgi:hypothetical protein